ncbi:hypothetical protein Dda_8085 [Drechslerella dactyloides]|uniref:Uncharacterized protein n=1 Tax=Drechslerella dactyloides TaxID=74499 RepID=A0AAD6NGC6_DREDA|nr:hypothetical protein Dda_8085 [Drechslerella dactyloides]
MHALLLEIQHIQTLVQSPTTYSTFRCGFDLVDAYAQHCELMASGSDAEQLPLSADVDSVAAISAEAAAYLARLTRELEALETTQTALLHSHHATSTALADARAYNAVAPILDQLPEYLAKAARLKALMATQRTQVDRLLSRAEEVAAAKKRNAARMRARWEEEREKDKMLAARVVGSSSSADGNGAAGVGGAGGYEQVVQQQRPSTPVESGRGSLSPVVSAAAAASKTVVKRKKKARQAEIEEFRMSVHTCSQFVAYRNSGLLSAEVTTLGHLDVLIYLCPNCHRLWDMGDPRLAIIPKNVELFIRWEEAEAEAGIPVSQRSVPSCNDYDGGYAWYYLNDKSLPNYLQMPAQADRRNVNTKASPTALILKAGKAVGFPLRQPEGHGIPCDVRSQLCQLFNLWERPPPISKPLPIPMTETQPGPSGPNKGCSPTDDDEPSGGKAGKRGTEIRSVGKRRRTRARTAAPQGEAEDDFLQEQISLEEDLEQDFLFGPYMTAAKVMERLG